MENKSSTNIDRQIKRLDKQGERMDELRTEMKEQFRVLNTDSQYWTRHSAYFQGYVDGLSPQAFFWLPRDT